MQNDNTNTVTTPARRRHFSMLRDFHLADFFTLGNAACGVGAVLFAMLYMSSQLPFHFFAAAALAPAALLAFAAWRGRIGDDLYGGVFLLGPWLLHPASLLFALSGSLMISKTLHIPKL